MPSPSMVTMRCRRSDRLGGQGLHHRSHQRALQHLEDGLVWARDVGDLPWRTILLRCSPGWAADGREEAAITRDSNGFVEIRLGVIPRGGRAIEHAKVLLPMGRMPRHAMPSAGCRCRIGWRYRAGATGRGCVTYTTMDRPVRRESLASRWRSHATGRSGSRSAMAWQHWRGTLKFDQPDYASGIELGLCSRAWWSRFGAI